MSGSSPLNLLEELNRLETMRTPKQGGNRQFQRFLVRTDAELHPMDTNRIDRTPLEIKLRDISRGGLGFISQCPLPQGSSWSVCFIHRGYIAARQGMIVRHCRSVGDGLYLVGGQFCIDTGILALIGVDPARLDESDDTQNSGEAFLAPQDME